MQKTADILKNSQNILWLGAHKTGTTYLQGILDASSQPLLNAGVQYETLEEFREKFTRPLLYKGHSGRLAPRSEFRRGKYKTILFDENIPGLVQGALSKRDGLYPNICQRTRLVTDYLGFEPDIVVFGIRNLVGYLPSLYCEILKSNPFIPFEDFMKNVQANLHWHPTLKRLESAYPNATMLIYRAENLRGNEVRLLSNLAQIPRVDFRIDHKQERSGFSRKAIHQLNRINQVREVTRSDVHLTNLAHPKSSKNPGFDPFGEKRRARFEELYKIDSQKLAQDETLRTIDFGDLEAF